MAAARRITPAPGYNPALTKGRHILAITADLEAVEAVHCLRSWIDFVAVSCVKSGEYLVQPGMLKTSSARFLQNRRDRERNGVRDLQSCR